jgi:hypothetical protein
MKQEESTIQNGCLKKEVGSEIIDINAVQSEFEETIRDS